MKRTLIVAAGFTLVELLIASSIFVVVMLTVVTAFRSGVFGYDDIRIALRTQRIARQALERIRLDLRNALPFSTREAGFKGDGANVSFFTLVDIYRDGAWRREYAQVNYQWDGRYLVRTAGLGKEARHPRSSEQAQRLSIPSGRVVFQYAHRAISGGDLVFKDHWAEPQELPVMVRVSLTVNGELFQQTVALPTMGRGR